MKTYVDGEFWAVLRNDVLESDDEGAGVLYYEDPAWLVWDLEQQNVDGRPVRVHVTIKQA